MPNAALLFDMDGVIVDSNPVHRQAWVEYNRSQGMETTEAMQQFMYGKRNDELVRHYYGESLSDEEVARRGAAKEAVYRALMRPRLRASLVPGVRAFLERHRAWPAACATNAERANVDFVLDEGGLREFFSIVVDGGQVARPKPFPDIYLKAAELVRVPPARCLVLEDSETGLRAGLDAGMTVIGLLTTHGRLPGAALEVPDFRAPELEPFLLQFQRNP